MEAVSYFVNAQFYYTYMFCTFFHFKAYKLRFHESFNGFNCKYSGLIRYSF